MQLSHFWQFGVICTVYTHFFFRWYLFSFACVCYDHVFSKVPDLHLLHAHSKITKIVLQKLFAIHKNW